MSNVINLNARSLTPQKVLESASELDTLTHAYIVLVHDDGSLDLRASGDLSRMPDAALYLQHYAVKYVKGEIEVE